MSLFVYLACVLFCPVVADDFVTIDIPDHHLSPGKGAFYSFILKFFLTLDTSIPIHEVPTLFNIQKSRFICVCVLNFDNLGRG